MSSYVNFYIRGYDDNLLPIGSFSRGHQIYKIFDQRIINKYGELRPLSESSVRALMSYADRLVADFNAEIRKNEDDIKLIADMKNSSVDDKMSRIHEIRENIIDDIITERDQANFAYTYFDILYNMMQEIKYYDVNNLPKRTCCDFIYAGIDADPDNIDFDALSQKYGEG